jgi:6-pyruvoyltetrahydropterin/6-carboxytetrahydropterin synthase
VIRVTRRYRFSASHRLHTAALSEAENRDLYGKCNNPFGHGHNYVLEVSARGPVDPATGLAVNIEALDGLVATQILQRYGHRNLGADVPEFRNVVPTTENLGLEILDRLGRHWPDAFGGRWPALEKIRIAETDRNIFEVWASPSEEDLRS